ncbi:MAG: PAS domain S-box protein [Actinobacteria bacterium]|nr:PAS domain S-box protein [Actinomycetota bacterium]MCB9411351.1 PAS domain S-box protein [Actinomycetota bacterium]
MSADVTSRFADGPASRHEEWRATLFGHLPVGVVYQSPDGAIRDANSAAERILGLSITQMQGRTSIDPRWRAVREDHREFPGEEHPAMQVLATGEPVRGVTMGVFNPAVDDYRWILIDANPVPVGEQTWAVATFTDITDLKTSHESMTTLLESIDQHTIVSMTDVEGTITHANQAFCELSGYRRDELLGQNHRILKSGHHPPEFYTAMWDTLTSGRVWRGEVCNMRKDGSLYWVAASISPRHDMLGQIVGYVSVRTDVTAQKIAEREAESRSREDALTGLANRRHFDEQLHVMTAVAAATGEPLALAVMDVDWFKSINDESGHEAGDSVLRELADFLAHRVPRPRGLAARWGGDEFAVLIPGCDADSAQRWLADVWRDLAAIGLPDRPATASPARPDPPQAVTLSAGLAVAQGSQLRDPEDLLRTADRRLYEAKRRGRRIWVGPS